MEYIVLDFNSAIKSKLKKMGYNPGWWSGYDDIGYGIWIVVYCDLKDYNDYNHATASEACPIFKSDEFLSDEFKEPSD